MEKWLEGAGGPGPSLFAKNVNHPGTVDKPSFERFLAFHNRMVWKMAHRMWRPGFDSVDNLAAEGRLILWEAWLRWTPDTNDPDLALKRSRRYVAKFLRNRMLAYILGQNNYLIRAPKRQFEAGTAENKVTTSLNRKVDVEEDDASELMDLIPSEGDDPERAMFWMDFESAFEKLTPLERFVFKRKIAGYSTSRIANIVGMTRSGVNKIFNRARTKLARELADYGG